MILLKERLDQLLVERAYYPSREKAKASIMAGLVYVNKQISDKPGTAIDLEATIEVKNSSCPYVGRGGLKLAKAIEDFDLSMEDLVAVDIGASTGGFTDCMLQEGAKRVYSVDVGYGQLDYKLRIDPRVVNMEKVNVRYLDPASIPETVDFISIDVSFISLNLVLPVAEQLLGEKGKIVCLIKPQFEAGREQVGKHGVIRDPKIHAEVIEKVVGYGKSAGLHSIALSHSPMTGAKGNIEYLILMTKQKNLPEETPDIGLEDINRTVAEANDTLGR